MKITDLAQFENFLKTRIPTREALFMGDIGLKRAKYFLKLLGNPQNTLKVIHIAGTSGKGSTAYLLSHALESQGFSVGLSISPHVFDLRERMQINNQLPAEKMVLKYFQQILPFILQMKNCHYGMPTFFEINVGLAYYMFAQEKVDYAIMETGLGGTLDGTNVVTNKNKVCLLTKMGIDHQEILGKTISQITEQKAGIIQKQNTTISIQQTIRAQKIIKEKCRQQKSALYFVGKKNYQIISSSPQKTIFNFKPSNINSNNLYQNQTIVQKWYMGEKREGLEKLAKIELGLIGKHQAENCSLALTCLFTLAQRDHFQIQEAKLRKALTKITIPGRLEICQTKNQTVILDGAHNPQKMETFLDNLSAIYPQQKFAFLIAFKKGKDFRSMLKKIIPLADKILLTQFSTSGMDNHWNSIDVDEISNFLKSQNFQNFSIIENKKDVILKTIREAKKPVVITGSLYLISSIYSFLKR